MWLTSIVYQRRFLADLKALKNLRRSPLKRQAQSENGEWARHGGYAKVSSDDKLNFGRRLIRDRGPTWGTARRGSLRWVRLPAELHRRLHRRYRRRCACPG